MADSMQAFVARSSGLSVESVPVPEPGPGQVLVATRTCGICGSDLHAATHLSQFSEMTAQASGFSSLDLEAGIVFGHEYCAEVVDHGPGCSGANPVGSLVCSVPIVFGETGPEALGYSNRFPGGFAEYMVLQEGLLLPVPDGLPARTAAFTEPLAVGEHAVGLARLTGNEVCLVVGAGPVGLAVLIALRTRGAGPIVVADFSPARRAVAEALGADRVVDPAAESPYGSWAELGVPANMMERTMIDMVGADAKDAVIFEAVGVPGVLQGIIDGAPPRARVVVVGVCMDEDRITAFPAITKELDLRFSFGYRPDEFALTLERLGNGTIGVDAFSVEEIGLEGLGGAFGRAASGALAEVGKTLVVHGHRSLD